MTPRRGPAWCATTPPSSERAMRAWLPERQVYGPERAGERDIDGLNRVFAEAFTDRYRRDGLVGVRVPQLNPDVWRYALLDAGDGAMLWRDETDQVAAFNIAHRSGAEGWMGPLAVRPDRQGGGVGKTIVRTATDWLLEQGVSTLGLETMPRTVENIGFYARLGFSPGHLTVTLTNDIATRGTPLPSCCRSARAPRWRTASRRPAASSRRWPPATISHARSGSPWSSVSAIRPWWTATTGCARSCCGTPPPSPKAGRGTKST